MCALRFTLRIDAYSSLLTRFLTLTLSLPLSLIHSFAPARLFALIYSLLIAFSSLPLTESMLPLTYTYPKGLLTYSYSLYSLTIP